MKSMFGKINIPHFFKTKKFFILLFIFVIFFLFTPVSLYQISNKVEDFINGKAKEGMKKFEKQTGLKIEWKFLNFNIFIMTVELKGVKVIPLYDSNFQKIQTFHFLDGLQKIEKISARPSLYSLLFKKQIILSKLQIQGGDIYLKTLKSFIKKPNRPKTVALPINKILIKNTNLNLKHQDHNLIFSKVRSKVLQQKEGEFRFNLFVKSFRISQDLGFEELQNLHDKNNLEKEVFQLSFKGLAKKDRVSFEDIDLKNEKFQSFTDLLDIHFDFRGLKKVDIKSSGSLPFFLIQKGFDLMGRKLLPFDSLLSYKLNVQYRKNKGYHGFFDIHGKKTVFKSHPLKSFSLKGRLMNYLLSVDKGLIETQSQGAVKIKKGQWFFKSEPLQFNFSIESDQLSSDFLSEAVLNLNEFPIKGNFTGLIHCLGAVRDFYLKCETKGKSEKVRVQLEDQDEIISAHEINFTSDIEWENQNLNFTVSGEKSNFSKFYFKGKYEDTLNKVEADYSFLGNLYEDLRFNTSFPLEGQVKIQEGKLTIKGDKITLTGFVISPLLKIQAYKLKNVSSLYTFRNNQLKFFNIRGGTADKTNYVAECNMDFEKEELILKLEFPFFNVEDFLEAIKENISLPVYLKGTGAISFFMNLPWSSPEQKKFQLKGNLFNIFIDEDFFQQAVFDLGIQDQQGVVRSLFFKKGKGFVKGTGTFDDRHSLDLNIVGQNLSLERWEWINEVLPFNQSGDVNFNMKINGTPGDPKLRGNLSISNMFFYSYPVNNSNIKFNIEKSALSFSGNIMDEIHIQKFVYPFSKNSSFEVKGQFSDLNFIKVLFSKNRKEEIQNYSSKATGSFSLSRDKEAQKPWTGFIKINDFLISKSNKWIKSKKPFSIFLDEKKWSLTSAKFSHYNNENLVIEERENDKLFLSGGSYLGLFSIFFPFLKEFDGHIKGQLLMDNNLKQINPRGSFQIEKGLFSIDPLPDFTDIKTSLIFSKNNVFINDFTANAGGGLIKGEGTAFYDFIHQPRLNLSLRFFDARLNIPEDFNTKGSGEVQIQGEKAPYLISGQYAIDSGVITKDFLEINKKTKYDFSFLNEEVTKQVSLFKLQLNIKTNQAVDVDSSLIQSFIEGQADVYGPLESLLIKGQFNLSKQAEESLIFF